MDSARSVFAVDLDNDGDNDLVACDAVGGRIVWYENTDGLASFAAATDIAVDVGVREVGQPWKVAEETGALISNNSQPKVINKAARRQAHLTTEPIS